MRIQVNKVTPPKTDLDGRDVNYWIHDPWLCEEEEIGDGMLVDEAGGSYYPTTLLARNERLSGYWRTLTWDPSLLDISDGYQLYTTGTVTLYECTNDVQFTVIARPAFAIGTSTNITMTLTDPVVRAARTSSRRSATRWTWTSTR